MRTRTRRLRNLLITTTVCITLAVPMAFLLAPHVERWQRMGELDSADMVVRERALNYVILNAAGDERVRDGAAERIGEVDAEAAALIFRALHEAGQGGDAAALRAMAEHLQRGSTSTAMSLFNTLVFTEHGDEPAVLDAMYARMAGTDDELFRTYARQLDRVGAWDHPPAPLDLWLRSTELMLAEDDALARVLAVHRLADLYGAAIDARIVAMLERAIGDEDASVRYAALLAAAELAGAPAGEAQRLGLESVIAAATHDDEHAIARDAWLLLAVLDPMTGFRADWRSAPPEVAQAILYAVVKTNPMHPQPALDALSDASVPSQVRAAAAYALHMTQRRAGLGPPFSDDATPDGGPRPALREGEPDPLIAWRLALSIEPTRRPEPPANPATSFTSVDLARLYRGGALIDGIELFFDREHEVPSLAQLAILEGLPVDHATIPIHETTPDMLRLAAVAVTKNPQPADLQPLFESPQSSMRDLACIVAADRFDEAQNATLIESLLWNYNDNAKMSGAILAGLTNLQSELLAQKAEDEDIWTVKQVMRLGVWMQGGLPELDSTAKYMLARDDVPESTILLAMLHKGQGEALDHLFNPRGEQPAELLQLLDHHRWHRVLSRYLPADAPPLWHWADASLKQFQIDVLRNWWLVNRHRQSSGAAQR